MPLFLRFNNYIEFLIQSLEIVRNMQNCIETNDNLCTELEPPVVQWSTIHIIRNGQLQVIIQIINHFTSFWRQGSKWVPTTYDKIWNLFTNCHLVSWESLQPPPPPSPQTHTYTPPSTWDLRPNCTPLKFNYTIPCLIVITEWRCWRHVIIWVILFSGY